MSPSRSARSVRTHDSSLPACMRRHAQAARGPPNSTRSLPPCPTPGPDRVRPLTKRRSKRSKKALQFSYADLESGLVMRRKDSAEFSGEKERLSHDDHCPSLAGRMHLACASASTNVFPLTYLWLWCARASFAGRSRDAAVRGKVRAGHRPSNRWRHALSGAAALSGLPRADDRPAGAPEKTIECFAARRSSASFYIYDGLAGVSKRRSVQLMIIRSVAWHGKNKRLFDQAR